MHKPRGHRTVAKCGVRSAIEDRGGGLVQDGGGRLLHVTGLLILRVGVNVTILHTGHIEPFRGAWLVTCKVISRKKDGRQDRMINFYASGNHGKISGAPTAQAVFGT